MEDKRSNTYNTSGLEFLLYFALGWIFTALYWRVSASTSIAEFPWTGASLVVFAAVLPLAWNAGSFGVGLLRIAAPLIVLTLFLLRAPRTDSVLLGLQHTIDVLHFLFLFAVTFFTVQYSPAQTKSKPSHARKQQTTTPQRKPPPRPDVNAFDRLVGQERAVTALRETANVVRSGIRVGKRNAPHAVLLFLGPTGVGKTEAARALAQAVYGREDALIRFDMGQFTDAHQANRFYGPPPGYVGSDKGGQLTQAVLRRPKAVVLLDEVEKAHPQIWDAFLPVFDEGYITDGSTNQKVDLTNTIIVLTSNLLVGVEGIESMSAAELKDALRDTGVFRPELVGRINEVLVFDSLNNETIAEILRRRVDASLWSLADQGVSMHIDESAIEEMVAQVREAKYGVRQIDDVVRTYLRKAITEQQAPSKVED